MTHISSSLTMCDIIQKKSSFYNDDEQNIEARQALERMKLLEAEHKENLVTVRLRNGVILSTTNPDRIKQYEEYCKRKTGYYRQS
jgi:hypothetical protein